MYCLEVKILHFQGQDPNAWWLFGSWVVKQWYKGLWSVADWNFGAPNKYIWSLLVVNSAERASLTICEYLFSVSVKIRLT